MSSFLDYITEPFQYSFMQYALITAIAVALVCALLSCYLVLKGWSLMGDAISHSVLPGIVIAFWAGIPIAIGAFIAGMLSALGVGYLKENSRIKEDTAMGIVFSGMFALGILIFVKIETQQHLSHILFGNLLGIGFEDLIKTLFITALIIIVVLVKRRDLLLYCFDPVQAKVGGLMPKMLHYGLLMLLSLTIISAIQVVGVILVVAMLIAPGISAYLLTKRFEKMLIIASIISVSSSIIGTIISYHVDAATGPCIILLQAMVFFTALIYSNLKPSRTKAQYFEFNDADDGSIKPEHH